MALEKQFSFENSPLWKIKERLQFSGWLQYLMHGVWVAVFFLIAGVGRLTGHWQVVIFWFPFVIGIILFILLIGNIAVVKYGLHPAESIPPDKRNLDVFDLMLSRRSCRSFQPRDLTPDHHLELMEAVTRYSEQNHQLGKQSVRFEYIHAALKVWPVVGASKFLVAIAPREYNRLSIIDVGRSLQKIVLHATRMGLATCWIGPGADQNSIIEHLGDNFDPKKDHIICVCAIGYKSMYMPLFIQIMQKFQHKRLPLTELFSADCSLLSTEDFQSKPFSEYGRCYEACRWSPSSFNSQTTRCDAVTQSENGQRKLKRFDFYCVTESRYYAPVALGIWCANWETGCKALNKNGHFSVLSSNERKSDNNSTLPRYDISWIVS